MDIQTTPPNSVEGGTLNVQGVPKPPPVIKTYNELKSSLPVYMTDPMCRRWLLHINKVPYYTNHKKRSGKLDTPKDWSHLASFDEAYAILATGKYTGLGFALGPDGRGGYWQGIDLDDWLSHLNLWKLKLPGYVELSPSGDGFHAIGYGRHFPKLVSNDTGTEADSHGKYYTVTGNVCNESLGFPFTTVPVDLADFVEQTLCPIHGASMDKKNIVSVEPKSMITLPTETMEDLRSALSAIPADDYHTWIAVGQALRWIEEGFELWASWSAASSKFEGEEDLAKWNRFKGDHTSYKAVFAQAQRHSWRNPCSWVMPDPKTVGFGANPIPTVLPIPPPVSDTQAAISLADLGWKKANILDVLTNPEPPRRFLIEDLVPAGGVTLLSAHGGAGKSMWGLQAAISIARGTPIGGKKTIQGKVLVCSMEDDLKTIRLRLPLICKEMGVIPGSLECLETFDATSSPILFCESNKLTQTYNTLLSYLKLHPFDLVVIDNASNTFAANENDRALVTAFIQALAQLVKDSDGAVILLQHVNKRSAEGGGNSEGSGSTSWNNAPRSRLFMVLDKKSRTVTITHEKSNYGKLSDPIKFRQSTEGVLIYLGDNPLREEAEYKILFLHVLSLVDKFDKRNEPIPAKMESRPNAYKMMKTDKSLPNSINNVEQMYEILHRAEDDGLLERIQFYNNKNHKEKYQLTKKGYEILAKKEHPKDTNPYDLDTANMQGGS